MLAGVVELTQPGGGEELRHRERLQVGRQGRQRQRSQILGHVAGDGLAQALVVQHAPRHQRAFHGTVVRYAQQRADFGDAPELVRVYGHDLHIHHRHLPTHLAHAGGIQPSGRVAARRPPDEILRRDVVEFAAAAARIEIALVGHLIVQHWHIPIIRPDNDRHMTVR